MHSLIIELSHLHRAGLYTKFVRDNPDPPIGLRHLYESARSSMIQMRRQQVGKADDPEAVARVVVLRLWFLREPPFQAWMRPSDPSVTIASSARRTTWASCSALLRDSSKSRSFRRRSVASKKANRMAVGVPSEARWRLAERNTGTRILAPATSSSATSVANCDGTSHANSPSAVSTA